VWKQPDLLRDAYHGKPETYWQAATQRWLKPYYHDNVKKGKAFAALVKEVTSDLPPEGPKAAEQILMRLERRILNQSWPTLEEAERFKKNETLDKIDPLDLEEAAQKGRTNGKGMALLFEAVLEARGLHPRLGFVPNRHRSFLIYALLDVYQVNDHFLVGVPMEAARTLWFDCSLRFASPGLVHPDYQGVDALVLDTATWEPKPELIPAQPAAFNRSVYHFHLAFGDGEEKVELKAGFTGFPELLTRRRYMALSQAEADLALKEWAERGMKDATITGARVLDALNPDHNVHFEVTGRLDSPSGTFELNPFPGMPAPLWLPDRWPEPRTVPIMMEYLRTMDAVSDFTLPDGYALAELPPYQKENAFGRVLFEVTQQREGASTRVHVAFKVELLRLSAPDSAEKELRAFIGWVRKAHHTRLTLEKS
jgi:hypothetical protein